MRRGHNQINKRKTRNNITKTLAKNRTPQKTSIKSYSHSWPNPPACSIADLTHGATSTLCDHIMFLTRSTQRLVTLEKNRNKIKTLLRKQLTKIITKKLNLQNFIKFKL